MSDKIIRWPEVKERVALSRTTVWRLIQQGTFPAPVKLTDRLVGWREAEIASWLSDRGMAETGRAV